MLIRLKGGLGLRAVQAVNGAGRITQPIQCHLHFEIRLGRPRHKVNGRNIMPGRSPRGLIWISEPKAKGSCAIGPNRHTARGKIVVGVGW